MLTDATQSRFKFTKNSKMVLGSRFIDFKSTFQDAIDAQRKARGREKKDVNSVPAANNALQKQIERVVANSLLITTVCFLGL